MAEGEHGSQIQIPEPFEVFYRKEYLSVVALSYVLTGGRVAAEDIAQEAFLRCFRDWSRVVRLDSPAAWVRRIAINLSRSRFRRMRSEAAALSRLRASRPEFVAPEPMLDAFWAEVRRLPSRQAGAIALRYVEDQAISQIAEVLEVSEGAVKALLHQGRERLRRQLLAKGLVDDEV